MRAGAFVLVGLIALTLTTSSSRTSNGGDFYRLRAVTTDGKRTTLLFKSPIIDGALSRRGVFVDLSPDRKQALMLQSSGASSNLYLTDVHGRVQRLLTSAGSVFTPWGHWSPNGARFFYETINSDSCRDFTFWSAAPAADSSQALGAGQSLAWGPGHSFAIEEGCGGPVATKYALVFTDRFGQRHLIANEWAAAVTISPRGDRIAYETYGATPTLHIAYSDGSGEVESIPNASSAAWSPAGRRLAFVRAFGNSTWSGAIGVANADGTGIRTVVPLPKKGATQVTFRVPAWSPDGRLIAYARAYQGLETVQPDGRGRKVVARGSVHHIWWSRDGSRIYYDG